MKFKVGDRVAVYAFRRKICSVVEVKGEFICYREDGFNCTLWAHIKQVRKLKKKQRRVVWITEDSLNDISMNVYGSKTKANGCIKFVETKDQG